MVHGGMVSSDEACPSYMDIIRNFELAHEWLNSEFNVKTVNFLKNLTQFLTLGSRVNPIVIEILCISKSIPNR